jgi:hypothetical protein
VTLTVSKANSYHDIAARLGVRTITTTSEEIQADLEWSISTPLRQAAAVAVLKNPWAGTEPLTSLQEETERIAPVLAKVLSDRLLDTLGGAANIETFGKAAIVGTEGELEHAGALIHTPFFGNLVREFLEGTSVLCFTDGRSEAGTHVRVPMWHKTHATNRDHYQSIDVALPDAPHPDEIAVIAVASTGPRPFARIGDRTTDRPIDAGILEGLLA